MTLQTIQIERKWAMPNHKTFQIKPIKELIHVELGENYTDLKDITQQGDIYRE